MTTRFRIEGPPVIHQTLDGEVIVVNLDNGTYYRLDGTAAEIWSVLERDLTVDEVVAAVEPDAGAVHAFLAQLADERLIALTEGSLPDAPGRAGEIALEKFTDMHELLLLDPIHEVDERGWPNRAGDAA